MQDLLKHLPAVLYEYAIQPDGSRRFSFVSDACDFILGLSAQEVMKEAPLLETIVHTDDLNSLRESSAVCESEGKDLHWQGRMWVRGRLRWMDIKSNHELKSDRSIVRRGIIQDITERKEIAKENEDRYLASIERLPIGIVIHKGGKLLFANTQAQTILGIKRTEDFIGSFVMDFVHPDFHQRIIKGMKDASQGITGVMEEQKFLRKDGRFIFVETTTFPLKFQGDSCFQIIFRDVT